MGEKLEALFLTERYDTRTSKLLFKVFRTRAAARKYAKDMYDRQSFPNERYLYSVKRCTWGPEQ